MPTRHTQPGWMDRTWPTLDPAKREEYRRRLMCDLHFSAEEAYLALHWYGVGRQAWMTHLGNAHQVTTCAACQTVLAQREGV